MPLHLQSENRRSGKAPIKLILFSGLAVLAAGVFFLNAQENNQAVQPDPAVEPNALEVSAETNTPDATAETSAAVPDQKQPAADQPNKESLAESKNGEEKKEDVKPAVETSVTPDKSQAEEVKTDVKKEDVKPEEKSDQPEKTSSVEDKKATAGDEGAKADQPNKFEIDRKGKAVKENQVVETVKPAPAVKEDGIAGLIPAIADIQPQANPPVEGKSALPDKEAGGDEIKVQTPEELLAAQEEVRRQVKEVEGLKKIDQAYQEMSRNEFEKALTHFSDGLSVLPLRPYTVETRQKAMTSEAECEYRIALNNYQAGKVNEARENIRRALEYAPGHRGAARLSERIKQDQERRAEVEAQPVPPRKSPAFLEQKKTTKADIHRGREYMAIKEYSKAENEFRNVLADDKFNSEASANLKKTAETRYNLETDDFQRMKAEMLAQISDTWMPPVKRVATGPMSEAQETIIASQARRRLEEKLKNIMIQKIEFVDAKIEDVITYLHQQSLIGDRDSAPGEKGVNFLLRLNKPGQTAAPAAPAAADVFATEEAKPAGGAGGGGGITMTMRDISLMDAIYYITSMADLKYRIQERVVIIHSPDIALGEMDTRTYKVLPSTIDLMTGGGGASLTTTEAASDKMEIGQKSAGLSERKDIKIFLTDAGVPFPENTSIVYIPAPPLLIVRNTSENLENFERLLTKLNVPTIQVAIEARFVEIGQTDLQELGLEWLLTDNWELATKTTGERVQMNKNNLTKGLRELNVTGGQVGTAVSGTMGSIAAISSILTNPELTVVLHALEQKDGANLLSAPKVTTKSGSNAKIKVVEELIYPTEYQQNIQSLGTTSSGNQSVTKIVVTPSAFETRDLGVILDVTPTVGPDNETIDLIMLPQVVELARWIDYGSDQPTGDGNNTQHVPLLQPVFHCRDITTSISIWDGQTVVMGGLISEGQVNTEDKVPLLGDIPLLGYLFKTKTSRSVKKNLLIFVTANLVDPAGNKIKKDSGTTMATKSGTSSATP